MLTNISTGVEVLTPNCKSHRIISSHSTSISNRLKEEAIRRLTFRFIAYNGHGAHRDGGPSHSARASHLRGSLTGTRAAPAKTHRQSLSHIAIFSLGTFPAGQSERTDSSLPTPGLGRPGKPGDSHVRKSTGGKMQPRQHVLGFI